MTLGYTAGSHEGWDSRLVSKLRLEFGKHSGK